VSLFRIALANLRFPATPEESVTLAEEAIAQASKESARLLIADIDTSAATGLLAARFKPV